MAGSLVRRQFLVPGLRTLFEELDLRWKPRENLMVAMAPRLHRPASKPSAAPLLLSVLPSVRPWRDVFPIGTSAPRFPLRTIPRNSVVWNAVSQRRSVSRVATSSGMRAKERGSRTSRRRSRLAISRTGKHCKILAKNVRSKLAKKG